MPARAHEPRTPPQAKVAILTAGGLAPCLSSAVGFLIEKYTARNPSIEIICYISGYKGLLSGEHVKVTEAVRENASVLQLHGGSPIGNSRVKLTNVEDCVKRGLTVEGENPLHRAAEQLMMDQVTDAASFDSPVPLRHRRASSPSDEAVGGLCFDFEPVRGIAGVEADHAAATPSS